MSFPIDKYKKTAKSKGYSKEYIKDVAEYAQKLEKRKLPVIFSITHLANCLDLKPTELLRLAEYGNFFDIARKKIVPYLPSSFQLSPSHLESARSDSSKTIIRVLKRIWQKFIHLFKKSTESEDNNLSDNILNELDFDTSIIESHEPKEEFYYKDANEYHLINSNYKFFKLNKKNGGVREIMAPKGQLKNIQRWIKHYILDNVQLHENSYGFIPGKSIKDNASIHIRQECILNIDLLKFFDTITEERVFGMFKEFGYHPNLARLLASLTTAKHKEWYWKSIDLNSFPELKALANKRPKIIPQGAPTSPAISNILCRKLDNRLSKLASKCNCKYSRYADDITFSGSKNNIPSLKLITRIINSEGFYLNKSKVGYYAIGSKQYVTGLSVNDGVRIPRDRKRLIKQTLYYCKKFGVTNHQKQTKTANKKHFKEWLAGNIAFVQNIEPELAEKYWEEFNNINWE